MQHPRWRAGKLSTGFLAEEFPGGFHPQPPRDDVLPVLAAVGAAIDHAMGERKRKISGQLRGRPVTRERRRVVQVGNAEVTLDIGREDDHVTVKILQRGEKGRSYKLKSTWKPGQPVWTGTCDGKAISLQVRPIANGVHLVHRGAEADVFVYTEREAAAARLMPAKKSASTGKALRAPMPGLVISIAVAAGQEVKAGETLAVIEAMKMENVLRAERDGVVKRIRVKPGDNLAVDAVILEFA
jgi:propionyl-CoA carboxylase alpha chain